MTHSVRSIVLASAFILSSAQGFAAPEQPPAGAPTDGKAEILTLLNQFEDSDALLAHQGLVYVGVSRNGPAMSDYHVLVYNAASGKKTFDVTLPHSPTQLVSYGQNQIIAVGTDPNKQSTAYSILTLKAGKISVNTERIGKKAWAKAFVGQSKSNNYFIDFSGLVDDKGRTANNSALTLFTTAKSFFSIGSRTPEFTPARIPAPIEGKIIGDRIVILHKYLAGAHNSNAVSLDLDGKNAQELFETQRNYLTDFVQVSSTELVFSELGANQLLVVDANRPDLKATIAMKGKPRSLAIYKNCLLVGTESAKNVEVLLKNDVAGKVLETLSFNNLGDSLRGIKKIAVDELGNRVFAKSAYPCPLNQACAAERNAVAYATLSDATLAACGTQAQ